MQQSVVIGFALYEERAHLLATRSAEVSAVDLKVHLCKTKPKLEKSMKVWSTLRGSGRWSMMCQGRGVQMKQQRISKLSSEPHLHYTHKIESSTVFSPSSTFSLSRIARLTLYPGHSPMLSLRAQHKRIRKLASRLFPSPYFRPIFLWY